MIIAVIVAAGKGERLKAGVPKAWVGLGGKPLFLRSVEAFAAAGVGRIVLVVDRTRLAAARRLAGPGVRIVAGGRRRQDSVAHGVAAARPGRRDVVLVHDAARPFVTGSLIRAVAGAARKEGAAVAAVPAADTLKREGAGGVVAATVARAGLWQAQTPQGVRGDLVRSWVAALRGPDVTDDVQPLEAMGRRVRLVKASRANLKITVPEDLDLARRAVAPTDVRAGFGFDLHRLVVGRPLVLGGVRFPFPKGLEGHSDADLVCHALVDALLGATGGGDIGKVFGVRRAATRDASSLAFLAAVARDARARGFAVRTADVTLLAEAPKLGARREAMRRRLAGALGLDGDRVSVKATTAKKTGEVGRGEAMACFALVTVARS